MLEREKVLCVIIAFENRAKDGEIHVLCRRLIRVRSLYLRRSLESLSHLQVSVPEPSVEQQDFSGIVLRP